MLTPHFSGQSSAGSIFNRIKNDRPRPPYVQIRGEILTTDGETIIDNNGAQMNTSGSLVALADTVLDELIDTHIFIQNTGASGKSTIPGMELVNGGAKKPVPFPFIP